jgi:predicted MFS family arabinose efflux permease
MREGQTDAGTGTGTRSAILTRHPQLAAVLTAEALSATGDAVFWVGLLVYLLGRPNGTGLIALAAVARLGPRVVFGAAGGVAADRCDRRRLLVGLDLVRALLMVALAFAANAGASAGWVIVIVTVTYVLATPYRPALTAGIPLVVGESDAAAANALDGTVRQIATFLGPLLGSALLWAGRPSWTFACNAATFALSAVFLARVTRLAGEPPGARMRHLGRAVGPWLESFVEGVRAVRRQAGLPLMTWLVFVFSVAQGFELVLLVFVAQDQLALGADGVGVLSAAIGVGALLMVPLVTSIATSSRPALLVITSLILTSVPLALLGVIENAVLACAVLVALGVGVVVFEVLSITLVQRLSRIDLLGRVFGIENMAVNGGKLAGSLLGPLLVSVVSLKAALSVAALVVAVSALAGVPGLLRVARATAERRRSLEPVVNVLSGLALFDGASEPALERLAEALRPHTLDAGTCPVRQGDAPDHLYVIRRGTFDVTRDGVHVASIGPDDWFGEIGLLRGSPRTASVTARTEAEVWDIPGGEFLAAVNESAAPPAALLDGISARLTQLDALSSPGN